MIYINHQLVPGMSKEVYGITEFRQKLSPFKTGNTCRGGIGCGVSERRQDKRFCMRHLGQLTCTEIMVNTHEVNKLDLLNICYVFFWRIFQWNISPEYSLKMKCTYYLQVL